jgi:hypothetical protein
MSAMGGVNALAALRRFAQPRAALDRCELCAAELDAAHKHLVDRKTGQTRCACPTCGRLLSMTGPAWTLVRPRVQRLADFRLTESEWHALALPIDLAFFVRSSAAGHVVARYPSAGGTIESSLALPAWEALARANPLLADLEPDVEALLVYRAGGRRAYYLVSIDECYRLVGLIRRHWQGFSGGPGVWEAIDGFFDTLGKPRASA